ncbi:hypothetical protein C8J57DRAFT_1277864 [Mycena rebaudengoi]|nr:hypothetical protein C8J57DRAFT_1277864 [Mycena rebaudengoi]
MRAPRSLEDTTLLLEEPFASSFTGQEDIAKTALLALFQKTAKKVQAAPGGPEAAAAWLNMAFEANPRDQRRFSSRASRESRIAISFVRFYWCLYSQQDTKQLLHALPLPGYKPKQGQTSVTHDKANARDAKTRDAPFSEPTSPLSEASNDNVGEDPSYAYPLHKKESLSASIRSVSVRSDRDLAHTDNAGALPACETPRLAARAFTPLDRLLGFARHQTDAPVPAVPRPYGCLIDYGCHSLDGHARGLRHEYRRGTPPAVMVAGCLSIYVYGQDLRTDCNFPI